MSDNEEMDPHIEEYVRLCQSIYERLEKEGKLEETLEKIEQLKSHELKGIE